MTRRPPLAAYSNGCLLAAALLAGLALGLGAGLAGWSR
jgi:hypothetical protein